MNLELNCDGSTKLHLNNNSKHFISVSGDRANNTDRSEIAVQANSQNDNSNFIEKS